MMMQELKNKSICVNGTVTVIHFLTNTEELVNYSELKPRFNGHYSTNNSTVCFVDEDGIYVTPYTRGVIDTLRENGFIFSNFFVPFSNGEVPKFERGKWEYLRGLAEDEMYSYFESDCKEWCDEHGIGKLDDSVFENCLRIPRTGLRAEKFGTELTVMPFCNEAFADCTMVDHIGSYCANNGTLAFVYRDGHTYLTSSSIDIIINLRDAGYAEKSFWVPLSNGEVILDEQYASKWHRIRESRR